MANEPKMVECDACDELTLLDKTTEMYGVRTCPVCTKDADLHLGTDCPRCGKGVSDNDLGWATTTPVSADSTWARMCRWCAEDRHMHWSRT